MRSISRASTPASAIASFAARMARSLAASSGFAIRRSLMPVLVTIHSSEVSTIFSRSKLDSTPSGR
jgi:hypothetical protein